MDTSFGLLSASHRHAYHTLRTAGKNFTSDKVISSHTFYNLKKTRYPISEIKHVKCKNMNPEHCKNINVYKPNMQAGPEVQNSSEKHTCIQKSGTKLIIILD
jgi:hypothetical protein